MKKEMNSISICLVDDHAIVRQGIREILQRMQHYEVTSEFDSGEAFLEALPISPAPDVILLDYRMKQLDGIEVLKQLAAQESSLRAILLTYSLPESTIAEAYYFGVRGFLSKECSSGDLKKAIDNVVSVGYVDTVSAMRYIRNYIQPKPQPKIQLSPRESQFLNLVCDPAEFTYDQIADRMGLTVKAVEVYRANLFDRYNIRSKTGLVMFAYRHRLVDLPEPGKD